MLENSFFEIINSMVHRQEILIETADFELVKGIVKVLSVTDDVKKFLITYIDEFDNLKQVFAIVR
jgi:hypothetical protein